MNLFYVNQAIPTPPSSRPRTPRRVFVRHLIETPPCGLASSPAACPAPSFFDRTCGVRLRVLCRGSDRFLGACEVVPRPAALGRPGGTAARGEVRLPRRRELSATDGRERIALDPLRLLARRDRRAARERARRVLGHAAILQTPVPARTALGTRAQRCTLRNHKSNTKQHGNERAKKKKEQREEGNKSNKKHQRVKAARARQTCAGRETTQTTGRRERTAKQRPRPDHEKKNEKTWGE